MCLEHERWQGWNSGSADSEAQPPPAQPSSLLLSCLLFSCAPALPPPAADLFLPYSSNSTGNGTQDCLLQLQRNKQEGKFWLCIRTAMYKCTKAGNSRTDAMGCTMVPGLPLHGQREEWGKNERSLYMAFSKSCIKCNNPFGIWSQIELFHSRL